jgi:hypothetical protein
MRSEKSIIALMLSPFVWQNKKGDIRMLISEPPIHVSPSLARVFGFNEAAVIQEIHFWLNPNVTPHFSLYHKDGRYWIPDVFDQLFQKFSFWDEDTIAYMCAAFEQSGILMMLEVEDPSQSFGKIIYHTLNYDVLREMSSAKPMPTSPFIGSILGEPVLDMGSNFDPAANENINIQSSFLVRIHKSAPDVYVMEVQDSPPFLMSELLLELEARPEKVEYQLPIEDLSHKGAQHKEEANETMPGGLPSKDLICHFPKIGDVELKAFVWGDTTLYKIVMVTFQMNILEEIFSFCETHKASRMVIFADNVDELGI